MILVRDLYINERIRATELRVIDNEGHQLGLMSASDALSVAKEKGLDLILISPTAKPPVAKIGDYGKFKYQQTKHEKETRKSQKGSAIKEIKLTPKIGEHDLAVRVAHTREFLAKGHKVKVSLFFRGREVTHKEVGQAVVAKLLERIADVGVSESPSKMEGRNMVLVVAPK